MRPIGADCACRRRGPFSVVQTMVSVLRVVRQGPRAPARRSVVPTRPVRHLRRRPRRWL